MRHICCIFLLAVMLCGCGGSSEEELEAEYILDPGESQVLAIKGWESDDPTVEVRWRRTEERVLSDDGHWYGKFNGHLLLMRRFNYQSLGAMYPTYYIRLYKRDETGNWDRISLGKRDSASGKDFDTFEEVKNQLPDPLPETIHTEDELRPLPSMAYLEFLNELNGDPKQALQSITTQLSANPENEILQISAMETAMNAGDRDALKALLDQYGESLAASDVPLYATGVAYYQNWLIGRQKADEGKNVAGWMEGLPAQGNATPPLEEILDRFSSVDYDNVYTNKQGAYFWRNYSLPNFLYAQSLTKVARIRAEFYLMLGDKEIALDLLFGIHALGAAYIHGELVITRLIGIAISAISTQGLVHACLNALNTPEEIETVWPRLERAYQATSAAVEDDKAFLYESAGVPEQLLRPNFLEARTRAKIALARTALLHSGVAARYHYLKTGSYPSAIDKFGDLLPNGSDADPFGDRLLLTTNATGSLLYSVGPDEQDNQAAVEYDPTNGTISAGDLSLKLPFEREYPFPEKGGLPRTRDGILAMFPNGLPRDPFSDIRGMSYTVSDTRPAVIWSFGPDVDQAEYMKSDFHRPEQGPPPPAVGVATRGKDLYYLENRPDDPFYDPSNGTISDGNLYLIVP